MSDAVSRPAGRDLAALWIVALVLAIGGLGWALTAVNNTDVPPSAAFYEYNAARVAEFAERTAGGAIGVVMFGDSRLRYGTEVDDHLSAELSNQLGADVAVLRLVNNWAVFEDFEGLVPRIEQANPTLVLIQDELRVKNRADAAGSLLRREYLVWRAFGSGPWNPGDLDQWSLQEEMRCEVLYDESVELRRERVFRWVDFDPDGPNAPKVARFVSRLQDADVEVRYLSVPITAEARAGLPGIEPTGSPDGLVPDIEIADDDYCDVVHMNPEGRERYTEWLVSTVSQELAR